MKAARASTRRNIVQWARELCGELLDLIQSAQTLDIIIIGMGYVSMYLTFISLFLSLKRLGSRVWLATSVLLSSTFASLMALDVTVRLGVPISMRLLSEGLPFLVVIVGFEKSMSLTRAVLSHAIQHRKPQAKPTKTDDETNLTSSTIQYAVRNAIRDEGSNIVCHYAVKIALLILGAASGVQGGLNDFCFLAALILFFTVFLFTFYTAILSVKLEINRMKRSLNTQRALEDDGISRRTAESVSKNEGSKYNAGAYMFCRDLKTGSIPKFKFCMAMGFFAVNLINICSIHFHDSSVSSWTGSFGGSGVTCPFEPFKVAGNGLDEILFQARGRGELCLVTVLAPIKYQLRDPSVQSSYHDTNDYGLEYGPFERNQYAAGGRMVDSFLTSLEDPVLSKWIFMALVVTVALNSILSKAARSGIKDPNVPDHPVNPTELAQAERCNVSQISIPQFGLSPAQGKRPTAPDDKFEAAVPEKTPAKATEQRQSSSVLREVSFSCPQSELNIIFKEKRTSDLTDDDVVALSLRGKIPGYALEGTLKDYTRAVKVRRSIISRTPATAEITNMLESSKLPYKNYYWERVFGACCENFIGYMPVPVGVAGPLVLDGRSYFIPMATTEGVLVASASRGSKAINLGGGAVTVLTGDGMTRGPCVNFEVLERAGAAKDWLDSDAGQKLMKDAFNSTSRFARLVFRAFGRRLQATTCICDSKPPLAMQWA